MSNVALLAYIVSAAAWLFAAGMLVVLYLRGRTETRFFRSLAGKSDGNDPAEGDDPEGRPSGRYDAL